MLLLDKFKNSFWGGGKKVQDQHVQTAAEKETALEAVFTSLLCYQVCETE